MLGYQRTEQLGLADTRAADDRHHRGAVGDGAVKAFGELGQFELAPDAAGRPDEHRHIVVAWRASAEVAAGDGQHGAGDVGRLVGGQEADRGRLLVERAVPLQQRRVEGLVDVRLEPRPFGARCAGSGVPREIRRGGASVPPARWRPRECRRRRTPAPATR